MVDSRNRWVPKLQVMTANKPPLTMDMIEMCIKDGHEQQILFGPIWLHIINYFDNKRRNFTFKGYTKVVKVDFYKMSIGGHFQCDPKPEENDLNFDLYRIFIMATDKIVEKPIMFILYDMAQKLIGFDAIKFVWL